jgi:hypothetical protein
MGQLVEHKLAFLKKHEAWRSVGATGRELNVPLLGLLGLCECRARGSKSACEVCEAGRRTEKALICSECSLANQSRLYLSVFSFPFVLSQGGDRRRPL